MTPISASSCCTPDETASHAARSMRDSGCGCAPVVDNRESLKLVGVVTERDICCHVAAEDRHPSTVQVSAIMRPASNCCGADESLADARKKLHEHRTTSLPVVNKSGACCGIVSSHATEASHS